MLHIDPPTVAALSIGPLATAAAAAVGILDPVLLAAITKLVEAFWQPLLTAIVTVVTVLITTRWAIKPAVVAAVAPAVAAAIAPVVSTLEAVKANTDGLMSRVTKERDVATANATAIKTAATAAAVVSDKTAARTADVLDAALAIHAPGPTPRANGDINGAAAGGTTHIAKQVVEQMHTQVRRTPKKSKPATRKPTPKKKVVRRRK